MQFRLGHIIDRGVWIFLALLLIMFGGSVFFLPSLSINQDYNDYLPKGDPILEYYEEFVRKMGSEDDMMMIAVSPQGGIFNYPFLVKLDSFTVALDSLQNIRNVLSLTNVKRQVLVPGSGVLNIPFLDVNKVERYARDSSRIIEDPRMRNWLISEDASTVILLALLEQDIASKQADLLIREIDRIAVESGMEEMHKFGRLYWEVSYNRLANKELKKGFIISILLICITMLLLYRSWRILAVTLTIYLLAGTLQFGYMALLGRELNAMSNLIPVILLIVSISDVIHILEKYRFHQDIANQRERIIHTINDVGLSVFLTSLTTSIGFLTFGLSPVTSVRNFGIDLGTGVMLTFFISVLCLYLFMKIVKIRKLHRHEKMEAAWDRIAGMISGTLSGRRALIPVTAIVLTTLALVMITQIDRNNYITSSMPSKIPLSRDVQFFNTQLGGARTFEFAVIPVDSSGLDDLAVLEEIAKVHDYLEDHPAFGAVLSTATLYKSVNNVLHPSRELLLPENENRLREAASVLNDHPDLFSIHLVDSARTTGRISGRMTDSGRLETTRIINEVTDWISTQTNPGCVTFTPTGSMMITDRVQQSTLENLIIGLAVAILAIGLLISFVFWDFRITVITILGNLIPILIVAGLMPLYHIQLRYGTSIIFTIGFVIAIDDTIHLISNFRLLQGKGTRQDQLIRSTLMYAGKAISFTSLILFLAFISLVFSEFRDSFAIGALLGSMIIIALLTDLFLLTWMLQKWVLGKGRAKQSGKESI